MSNLIIVLQLEPLANRGQDGPVSRFGCLALLIIGVAYGFYRLSKTKPPGK